MTSEPLLAILVRNPELIISSFSALSSFFLVLLILPQWNTRGGTTFCLLVTSMGLWQFGKLGFNSVYLGLIDSPIKIWEMISFTGATLIYPLSLRFAIQLSTRIRKWFGPLQFLVFFSGFYFILLDYLGYFSIGRRFMRYGMYRNPSSIYIIYTIVFIAVMGLVLYFLWPGHYKKIPQIYRQGQAVFFGSLFGFGIGTLEFLPIYGISIYPLADFAPVIFGGSLYWAIYRWNAWGGNPTLRKVGLWLVGWALFNSGIFVLYKGFKWIEKGLDQTNLALYLVFLIISIAIWALVPMLFKWGKNVMRFFYPAKVSAVRLYASLVDKIDVYDDPREVINLAIMTLQAEFGYFSGRGVLLTYSEGQWSTLLPPSLLVSQSSWSFSSRLSKLNLSTLPREPVSKTRILEELRMQSGGVGENKNLVNMLRLLTRLNCDVYIPLKVKKDLAGFLCFRQPIYHQESWTDIAELLEQLGSFLGYQLTQIFWGKARETEHYLSRIGMMSASLAHEIKNPLEGIYGAAQVLSEDPPQPQKWIGIIHKDALRLNALVRRFLDFASPTQLEIVQLDLLQLAQEFIDKQNSLDPAFPLSLALQAAGDKTENHGGYWQVRTDAHALEEILENLVQNARRYQTAGSPILFHLHQRKGVFILGISDNGPGVSAENRSKLFSPFFTTHTQGTGLGLATSRKIAWQLGGDLQYRPLPSGSLFELTLKGHS